MKNNKKSVILVTGHAGFIGSHLTEKLLDDDYQVIGVDNFNDYYDPQQKERNVASFSKNPNFKQYRLDILDYQDLKQVFIDQKIDLIVHLAARAGVRPSIANPLLYEEVNVKGTLHLLELAKEFTIKQFIFGSSSSVYGDRSRAPFSESEVTNKPISPYAATKKSAELLCHCYSHLHHLNTTILRFFTVYGPKGRPDMAPYSFTQALLKGQSITRFGDGSSSRDYTYVDDIVAGILAAINRPFKFEIFNLGNNQPVKLSEFISLLEKLTDKKAKIVVKPSQPGDVKQTCADISKAKKMLGWRPKTGFEAGMKQLVVWIEKNLG